VAFRQGSKTAKPGSNEQKLHTEAIRSDEVPHDTEVLYLVRGVEIVDVAAIDTRIFILPREILE